MKDKLFKIKNVFINIFVYVFLFLSLILLIFTITSKKDTDGGVNIFNHQFRIVISESMEKNEETYENIKKYKIKDIKVKSLLIIEKVSNKDEDKWYENIKVGDVLTFKYTYDNKQETITHRVINKESKENEEGYIITLQGDNKSEGLDTSVQIIDTHDEESTNYIIGKVKTKSYLFGLMMYSIKQPLGTILLVIVPCMIIIVLEIIKIVSVLNTYKKNKEQLEIKELKEKLKALEEKQQSNNNV